VPDAGGLRWQPARRARIHGSRGARCASGSAR